MRAKRNCIGLLAVFPSLIFCVAVCAAAVYFVHANTQAAAETMPNLQAGGDMKMGTLIGPGGRQKELDATVEERMVALSANATPFIINGRGRANLCIGDPPENGNRFTVTIIRDDTRKEIYRLGYLDPEQYTDEVALDVELGKGEYARTMNFDTYRIRDNSYIGRAAAQITLYMLEQRYAL